MTSRVDIGNFNTLISQNRDFFHFDAKYINSFYIDSNLSEEYIEEITKVSIDAISKNREEFKQLYNEAKELDSHIDSMSSKSLGLATFGGIAASIPVIIYVANNMLLNTPASAYFGAMLIYLSAVITIFAVTALIIYGSHFVCRESINRLDGISKRMIEIIKELDDNSMTTFVLKEFFNEYQQKIADNDEIFILISDYHFFASILVKATDNNFIHFNNFYKEINIKWSDEAKKRLAEASMEVTA